MDTTNESAEPEAGETETPPQVPPPAPPPPAVEPEAEKKAVEDWAKEAEMLPEVITGGNLQVNAHPLAQLARVSLRRSSEVARRHNPRYRLFAAAKAMFRWPEGLQLTKADFDEAVEAADTGVEIR